MKHLIYILTIGFLVFSCSSESDELFEDMTNPNSPIDNENISEKGYLEFTGSIQMTDGPTDLLIEGNHLYAVRDNKIFQFSLSNPAIPQKTNEFSLSNSNHKFGKLSTANGNIYSVGQEDGFVYEFNSQLNLINKYDLAFNTFKPTVLHKDDQGVFWLGGSNGSNGIIAQYKLMNGQLTLINYNLISETESNVESIIEQNGHIITSIANGKLLSFKKDNLQQVAHFTYQHEEGHEKWGHTIIKHNNKAYWANWGAGFATVDISNPTYFTMTELLSNSGFKAQFPHAEGTNVYDVAYNAEKNLLCVANGWSGVLLIRPNSPGIVYDFIDPQYFQNRSIETKGNYIYTGNISGGMSGNMKGIKIFKIKS